MWEGKGEGVYNSMSAANSFYLAVRHHIRMYIKSQNSGFYLLSSTFYPLISNF